MPRIVRGTKYYRTAEACETAGISKNTFFRWLRCGEFEDVATADRHGWRLFSETDLERLCEKAQHISSRELVGIP